MKRLLLTSVLLLTAGLGPSTVRDETASSLPPPRETPPAVRSALEHLSEEVRPGDEGSLAISNGNYRAAFSKQNGVVFTPRIEGAYDERLTWQYRVRSLETDTSRATLDSVEPVVSQVGHHAVDFERPGIFPFPPTGMATEISSSVSGGRPPASGMPPKRTVRL